MKDLRRPLLAILTTSAWSLGAGQSAPQPAGSEPAPVTRLTESNLKAAIEGLQEKSAVTTAASHKINGLSAHLIGQLMFYPPPLIRLGVSGRVVLAYSVGLGGLPERVVVLVSDDARLEKPAVQYLRNFRFDVPPTWEADAGQWRRLHLEFSFTFDDEPPRPKLVEDGEVIVVTAHGFKRQK